MRKSSIYVWSQGYRNHGENRTLPSVQENFVNLWGWNEYMNAKVDFGLFYENILTSGVMSLVFSHSV
jgi:hypothetical protein